MDKNSFTKTISVDQTSGVTSLGGPRRRDRFTYSNHSHC